MMMFHIKTAAYLALAFCLVGCAGLKAANSGNASAQQQLNTSSLNVDGPVIPITPPVVAPPSTQYNIELGAVYEVGSGDCGNGFVAPKTLVINVLSCEHPNDPTNPDCDINVASVTAPVSQVSNNYSLSSFAPVNLSAGTYLIVVVSAPSDTNYVEQTSTIQLTTITSQEAGAKLPVQFTCYNLANQPPIVAHPISGGPFTIAN